MAPTIERTPRGKTSLPKIVLISSAGSAIDWYDFFIYNTAAALVFGQLFFPQAAPLTGTLLAFSTYAVGFAARPLGGVVFGHVGDRLGRKRALVTAMLLMGCATMLIGLLPTHHSIGAWGPVALVALRLLQGIAVGGHWAGAVLIATENAPANRRGLYGSFAQLGAPGGLILASLAFLAVSSNLTEAQFLAWGWRVPFLASVVLIGLAIYAQFQLDETEAMKQVQATDTTSRSPVLDVLRTNPRLVLLAAGVVVVAGASFYFFATYILSYATTVLGMPRNTVLAGVLVAATIQLAALPAFGALSDRVGRRTVYLAGTIGVGLWIIPAFALLNTANPWLVSLAIIGGQLTFAMLYGPQAAFFAELFSARLRYTGASLGYQLGVMLGGALTPIIATWLYARYDSYTPIAAYMIATAALSAVCLLAVQETYRTAYDEPPTAVQPDPANA